VILKKTAYFFCSLTDPYSTKPTHDAGLSFRTMVLIRSQ
jgi:hypothetical protein